MGRANRIRLDGAGLGADMRFDMADAARSQVHAVLGDGDHHRLRHGFNKILVHHFPAAQFGGNTITADPVFGVTTASILCYWIHHLQASHERITSAN